MSALDERLTTQTYSHPDCGSMRGCVQHHRGGEPLCALCQSWSDERHRLTRTPPGAKCGEPSGAQMHRSLGEKVCESCRIAEKTKSSDRYAATHPDHVPLADRPKRITRAAIRTCATESAARIQAALNALPPAASILIDAADARAILAELALRAAPVRQPDVSIAPGLHATASQRCARPPDPTIGRLIERILADDESPEAIAAGNLRAAELLGLPAGPGEDGEALLRCQAARCGAYYWAGNGAVVRCDDGTEQDRCAEHADPCATFVEVGDRLQDAWTAQDGRQHAAEGHWLAVNGGR